ncbi:Cdc25 phosphatase Ibp1 [Paraconiothyrium brasiliense]|uniref:Cdc25 phosphatase Ibp1 n=1 Tax=Paraconiothyrium brasiliense TaxID=300254 RepID=A0ABR3QJN9_9PLEO
MSDITLSNLSYISREELAEQIRNSSSATFLPSNLAIIDVRDSDHIGGHIRGSTWIPSNELDYRTPELVRNLGDKEVVVFHCALSQQRGPSAALRYLREKRRLDLGSSGETKSGEEIREGEKEKEGEVREGAREYQGEKPQKVLVLRGGFTQWQEKYGSDKQLTEAWQKDIWEFGCLGSLQFRASRLAIIDTQYWTILQHYEITPRFRSKFSVTMNLLEPLQIHIRKTFAHLKSSIPLFQSRCAAHGCHTRLKGPSTHRRKHADSYGTLNFQINDPLCDDHMLQLWDDIVSLDAKVERSRRVRVGKGGQAVEREYEISFVEEQSEIINIRSLPKDGDEKVYDFCDVEGDDRSFVEMSRSCGGNEMDWLIWCSGEGAWWKIY